MEKMRDAIDCIDKCVESGKRLEQDSKNKKALSKTYSVKVKGNNYVTKVYSCPLDVSAMSTDEADNADFATSLIELFKHTAGYFTNPLIEEKGLMQLVDFSGDPKTRTHYVRYKMKSGGSLKDAMMTEGKKFTEDEIREIVKAILKGLFYLASEPEIVHIYIAPEHILIERTIDGKCKYLLGGLEYCVKVQDLKQSHESELTEAQIRERESLVKYIRSKSRYSPKEPAKIRDIINDFEKTYTDTIGRLCYYLLKDPTFSDEKGKLTRLDTAEISESITKMRDLSNEFKSFIQHCMTKSKNWGLKEMAESDFVNGRKNPSASFIEFPSYRYKEISYIYRRNETDTGIEVKKYKDEFATDERLREVAIKQIKYNSDEKEKKKMDREISILLEMRNSNNGYVAEYIDSFMVKEETTFIVMEYIKGQSLENFMNTKLNGRSLSDFEISIIAWNVASALKLLHNHSIEILHRDIKPANVLVTPERDRIVDAKLTDK